MGLSIPEKSAVDIIISKQEGGWKLTHLLGDNDGGWTYAGVTASTFNDWIVKKQNSKPFTSKEEFASYLEDGNKDISDTIYDIYEANFVRPLQLEHLPNSLFCILLSCAINDGVDAAISILQAATNSYYAKFNPRWQPLIVDGELGEHTIEAVNGAVMVGNVLFSKFLYHWTLHYVRIVKKKIDDLQFLEGWINRVEFWRS